MRALNLLPFLIVLAFSVRGQELNCKVTVNSQQIQTTDRSVFKDMETALANFMNTRKWTNDTYKSYEKINCSIFLNLKMISIGNFTASVQVASARPIFNTNYESVVFNFADRDWEFEYIESQPLEYNDNNYITNLTSMLAYYAYIIIGMDYDSFSELGGNPHFQKALAVVNNAQPASRPGWEALGSTRNRYSLITDILNQQLVDLRKGNYRYHRLAMDTYDKTPDASRDIFLDVLKNVKKVWQINPASVLVISFFDAKATELVNIFSDGALQVRRDAYDILSSIDSKRTIYGKIVAN